MEELLQRRGKFIISRDYIWKKPGEVLRILTDVLVVQTSDDFMRDSQVYIGYSKHFDVIKDESPELPEYTFSIDPESGNVTWHREKEYSEEDVKSILKEIKEELRKRE